MKKILIAAIALFALQNASAQSLEKMQWFNEPEKWEIKNNALQMFVTPQSDYWRISHYGFTVDDAPFYYATYGGEFEAKVKLTGAYKERFDQMGLMVRIDEKNYIKTGIEFVDGKYNVSTVVTHGKSDWSVTTLDKTPPFIWIKVVRRLDAVEIFYSYDDKTYVMTRNAPLRDNTPVMVGLMAASPDGKGFDAKFENFKVTHYLTNDDWNGSRKTPSKFDEQAEQKLEFETLNQIWYDVKKCIRVRDLSGNPFAVKCNGAAKDWNGSPTAAGNSSVVELGD